MQKKNVAIYVGHNILYPITPKKQIEFLKSEIKKSGYELVGIYSDSNNIKGPTEKRLKFNEMIKDAREGHIDGIFCASLTSLSIYPLDCKMIINEALGVKNKHNFWLNFFLEDINTSNESWETKFNFMMILRDENIKLYTNVGKMTGVDGEELIGVISEGIRTKLNIVKEDPLYRLSRHDV